VSALYSLNVCICAEETATHNTCTLPVYFLPTSVLVKVMMSYSQETDTSHEGSHFSSYCSLLLFLCIFCKFPFKYSRYFQQPYPDTHTHMEPLTYPSCIIRGECRWLTTAVYTFYRGVLV